MANFASTSDVRSLATNSTTNYALIYSVSFTAFVTIQFVLQTLNYDFSSPFAGAALAAYICTSPRKKPRFRSLARFSIAFLLCLVHVVLCWTLIYLIGLIAVSASPPIVSALLMTVACGCIEGTSFLWTCLITPPPKPNPKTGG